MTPWQTCGIAFGFLAYAVAWVWGGRLERFGAGVLLFSCLLAFLTYQWEVGGHYPVAMALDSVRLLVFGWLCFRLDRWWPFVVTAAIGLMVMGYVLRLLDPTFSHLAMASAHIGLGYLIDLALLLGVFERWLAGEPAAGPAAWAKADRATEARRALREETPGDTIRRLRPKANRGRNRRARGTFSGSPTIGESG
ncbi:MAG: hypothetical protein RDU12_14470 [Brevundimonas sp.]|nr:hypothetical protein [Brevundimonas sp.]